MPDRANRYQRIIERIFQSHYHVGMEELAFGRDEIIQSASDLGIQIPKNVGDVIYTFRYRAELPRSISERAPQGKVWIIRPAGKSQYRFVAVTPVSLAPNPALAETKVPDATPGVIAMYALSDEQALLAKLRYNRLVDTFTGVTCYSLQSHLRTYVKGLGQVEADEIYVGLDRRGAHYVFPIEAKGVHETLGAIQVEQGIAVCEAKFPGLICRPIGASFMQDDLIALFEFEDSDQGIRIRSERHYKLVPPEALSADELASYQTRPE
jgi:hypothetical protein